MSQIQWASRSRPLHSWAIHAGGSRYHHLIRLFALAAALIVVCGAVSGCAGPSTTSARATSTTTIAPTPTFPATTEGRLTLRARQAVGAAAQQVSVRYQSAVGVAVVNITLVWQPGWKTNFSQAQAAAKLACYQTQAALWTSGIPLNKVTTLVLGQALNDYAEVITSVYAEADLSAQHGRVISWSTINSEQAWTRYDNEFLRPTYAPNWIYESHYHRIEQSPLTARQTASPSKTA